MKILHLSDLHSNLPQLKLIDNEFDCLVISGDICPNNLKDNLITENGHTSLRWFSERDFQKKWLNEKFLPWINTLPFKYDDIILLNGNHDLIDFTEIFKYSLYQGESFFNHKGLKFGLITGVLKYSGLWFDEINEDMFMHRILALPQDLDILITHCPPSNIMDNVSTEDNRRIGSSSLYKAIFGLEGKIPYFNKLSAHFYGHVHGHSSIEEYEICGKKVQFSNSASGPCSISL